MLGYGSANRAVAAYLENQGRKYTIYDDNIPEHTGWIDLTGVELAVKSSGFPTDHPMVEKCLEERIEVISDLELFYRCFPDRKTITVTGTNGKTTTAALIAHLMPDADLGGNIGTPLFTFTESERPLVIEASSFMLESCRGFRTDVAVVLNITPHHLSRHGDFEAYASAKGKIVAKRRPEDVLIYNADDERARVLAKTSPGVNIPFSVRDKVDGGFIEDGKIYFKDRFLLDADAITLPGAHNRANALAVLSAVCAFQPDIVITAEHFQGFRPFPHRIEHVATIAGIKYYNDSKATNPAALAAALALFSDEKVLLICGGKEEEADFSLVARELQAVRRVIACGENRQLLADFFRTYGIMVVTYPDLASALDAHDVYLAGITIVLFSPGAPSYDQFHDYAERGRYFTERIRKK